MTNKYVIGGLAALTLLSVVGGMSIVESVNQKRKENLEYNQVYDDIKTIHKLAGGEWAEDQQKLLDNFGVDYELKPNEKVKLIADLKGAYVMIEEQDTKKITEKAFIEKPLLDYYIFLHSPEY